MSSQFWWHVSRATGITAWALMCASVMWGILISGKFAGAKPRPAWTLDLHRFMGGLAVIFTLVHLAGLMLDSYIQFGYADLLVPFASSWKTGAVAWGVVGFYLLLAIEITSLVQKKLPRKLWRGVHMSSYPLFVFTTIHLYTAGTDRNNAILKTTMILVIGAVLTLSVLRYLKALDKKDRPSRPVRASSDS